MFIYGHFFDVSVRVLVRDFRKVNSFFRLLTLSRKSFYPLWGDVVEGVKSSNIRVSCSMKLRQFKALKLKWTFALKSLCPILTLFFSPTSEQLLLVGQDSAKLIKPGHLHFHRRSLRDNINIRTDGETIPAFCVHFYKYEKYFHLFSCLVFKMSR